MCTAAAFTNGGFYFGRTLDYEHSFGEEVVLTPRNFPLEFRSGPTLEHHYAMLGMARAAEGYPLYFDAMNERGLAMAGLNFVGFAQYSPPAPGLVNVAHFEFIPWLLARCATVAEARTMLAGLNLTGQPFSPELPPARLHWIIADRSESVTVEAVREGLRVHPNPVGILTNNPPFDQQLFRLNDHMHLSPKPPRNCFSDRLVLRSYSRGMGALGLPGDWSSQSRFVRAAFVKLNSLCGPSEAQCVSQFFHILGSVNLPRGCCQVDEGKFEITRYTSCCSADRGIYYYTTYDNRQLTAVDMHRADLEADRLLRYPLIREEQVRFQN